MNRRDALTAILGAPLVSQIDDIKTVNGDCDGFVIETDANLPSEALASIREQWKAAWKGTPIERMPLIVFQGGLKLKRVKT